MKQTPRSLKMAKEMKIAISKITFDLNFKWLSVNATRISPDLRYITAEITSIRPEIISNDELLVNLNSKKPLIHKMLKSFITTKYMPDITFRIDKRMEEVLKMEKLLEQIA